MPLRAIKANIELNWILQQELRENLVATFL